MISKPNWKLVAISFLEDRKSITVLLPLKSHLQPKKLSDMDVDWDQSSPVSPVPASLLATLQLSQHLRPGLNLCTAPESVGNHISAKTFKSECSSKPFWSCWPPKWRRCWRRPWWWRRRWQRCESGSSRSPARQKVAVSSSRRLRRPELPFNEH